VDYEHVSWCTGTHDRDGECLVERTVSDQTTVGVQAVPCSHVNLWVDGAVYDVDELDRLIGRLQELRPLLAAADREAACEGHDHSDEADWTGPTTEDNTGQTTTDDDHDATATSAADIAVVMPSTPYWAIDDNDDAADVAADGM